MINNGIGIDINEIIKSAYSTVLETQQAATELVGVSCLWARATPVINSEDVILQEYTLTQVGLECPKQLRLVVSNTDYNPGEYTIDLYGLGYVLPLEINITIQEWNLTFGNTTMPLKGDVVYIDIYNKLYEVLSSELIYSVAALPTYYKVILSKYNYIASRQETDEFRQSIEDLTISLQELFGDLISEEVADNNATNETSYNNTTYVDPSKEFDIDSIIVEQIKGVNDNLISNAYYDFSIMTKDIVYHSDLIYEPSASRNHLIYSCWCMQPETNIESAKIKKLVFYSKDSKYWYFKINTLMKLELGDNITVTRGSLLKVNGIVVELDGCTDSLGIAIKSPEMSKSLKKLNKWYENSTVLKIYKIPTINLLKGYDENNKIVLSIDIKVNEISVLVGKKNKSIVSNLDLSSWNYFMFDISPSNLNVIIEQTKTGNNNEEQYYKVQDYLRLNENVAWHISDFNINEFSIENKGKNIYMCNIRMYENEYAIGLNYMIDKYSPVTSNASKLIFVDSPNIPNKEIFISPVK